jgi:ribokinase
VDVLAVGDLMLDVRVEAGALAPGGDVHGRVVVRPGGSAANAAVWAAWAGAEAGLLGRVGDAVAGRVLREALAERGVRADLAVDPEAPTGTMLVVHRAGERSMVADRGANARLSPSDLPAVLRAGAVLVSGYVLLQEGSREAGLAALERAEAGLVAVDAASWPLVEAYGAERLLRDLARANVLLANEREARALTGCGGADAARALGERFRIVAVKLGARGAVVCADGELLAQAAEEVVEVDPTGAGDAFDGVLLAELVRGTSLPEALARACHAGALQVSSGRGWPEVGAG